MKKVSPSRHEVWKMFDQISPTYDRANRLLSLGLDAHWRKVVAKHFPKQEKLTFLDLACGTGDQVFAIFDALKDRDLFAYGTDLSTEMLKLSKKKALGKAYQDRVVFQEGDAQKIAFSDGFFDAVTISFGIRNVMNLGVCFQEMHRALKANGKALILEFALPKSIFRPFYLFYLRKILPFIGKVVSKHPYAYQYLNETIETFPSGNSFSSLMKEAGFSKVEIHPLTLGTVNLYVGYK